MTLKKSEMIEKMRKMVLENEKDFYIWMLIAEESNDKILSELAFAIRNYMICKKGLPKKILEEKIREIENITKSKKEKDAVMKLKKVLFS